MLSYGQDKPAVIWVNDKDYFQVKWNWGEISPDFEPDQLIAFDSEFIQHKSYAPALSLVQIAGLGDASVRIYDVLQGDVVPWKLLLNHQSPILFHSAFHDLAAIYYHNYQLPITIIDSQLGFGLCSLDSNIGLADLAYKLAGIKVSKKYSNSNWSKRPLSINQLDYSANDVGLLLKIYPYLADKLQNLGRFDWWLEDSQYLVERVVNGLNYCPEKIAGFAGLSKRANKLAVGFVLVREKVARKHNINRQLLLSDNKILEISKKSIKNLEELVDFLPEENYLWDDLALLDQIFTQDPITIAKPAKKSIKNKYFLSLLSDFVVKIAEQLQVNPLTIISSKELKKWCNDGDWGSGLLMRGWRKDFFADFIKQNAP